MCAKPDFLISRESSPVRIAITKAGIQSGSQMRKRARRRKNQYAVSNTAFGVVGPDPFALLRTDEGLRASFALGRHHPQAKRLFGVRLEKSRRVEAVGERRDFTVRRLSE